MKLSSRMTTALALGAVVAALAGPSAPLAALAKQMIPVGAGMSGTLNNALDTKSSYAGQPFSISVVPPFYEGISALGSSTIYGHVSDVVPGGRGRNPQLALHLDSIKFADGVKEPIGAAVKKLEPQSKQKGRVLLGTAGGMFLGNWAGKAMFGGSAGGAVGAAAGFLLSSNNKQDFHVPAGSPVGIQLTSALTVP